MSQELINILIVNVVYPVATVLAGIIATYIIAWIRKAIGTETLVQIQQQMELKQGLAYDTVMYVQQVWGHLDGADKKKEAINKFVVLAAQKGIVLTDEEIEVLLESAVKALKAAWNDAVNAV